MAHADRVRLNEEIKAWKKRLQVLRAEMQQDGAALEQLKREVAEFERQCGRIEKAKRCRVAMTTVAATAAALCRVDMAATDQVDTRAEMVTQSDEQIAALDLKIRQLQDSYIDHAAYRWCVLGFVPIVDARWKPVAYSHSDST